MEIILIIGIVYVVVKQYILEHRINEMEKQMSVGILTNATPQKKSEVVSVLKEERLDIDVQPVVNAVPTLIEKEKVAEKRVVYENSEPNFIDRFIAWCAENWLMKLGGLIILLGVAFFMSLAFKSMTSEMKLLIGYFVSVTVFSFGYWWMSKVKDAGAVIVALSSGVASFTTYAGMFVYNVFNPLTGVIISSLTALFIGVVAVVKNTKALAFLSFLLALASPLVFGYYSSNILEVFIYNLFITAVAVYIDYKKSWRELPILAFAMFILYTLVALDTKLDTYMMIVAFAEALLITIYTVTRIIKTKIVETAESAMMLISGLFVLFWIFTAARENMQAFIMILWALVFAGIAIAVYQVTKLSGVLIMYMSVATLYIFIATAKIFDGATLSIVFIVEGFLMALVTHLLSKDLNKTILASMTTFVGICYTFFHFTSTMSSADISVVLLQCVSMFTLGTVFYLYYREQANSDVFIGYPIVGLALLTILTIKQINNPNLLTISLSGLYMLAFFYAEYVLKNITYRAVSLLAFAGVYLVVFSNLIDSNMRSMANYNLYAVAAIFLIALLVVMTLLRIKKVQNTFIGYIAVSAMASYLVWLILHAVIASDGVATLVSLVVYAAVGYVLLIVGSLKNSTDKSIKYGGQAILCLVGLRVIGIDAWAYSTAIGVAICIVVGVILVATMFVTNKK